MVDKILLMALAILYIVLWVRASHRAIRLERELADARKQLRCLQTMERAREHSSGHRGVA